MRKVLEALNRRQNDPLVRPSQGTLFVSSTSCASDVCKRHRRFDSGKSSSFTTEAAHEKLARAIAPSKVPALPEVPFFSTFLNATKYLAKDEEAASQKKDTQFLKESGTESPAPQKDLQLTYASGHVRGNFGFDDVCFLPRAEAKDMGSSNGKSARASEQPGNCVDDFGVFQISGEANILDKSKWDAVLGLSLPTASFFEKARRRIKLGTKC